MIALLTVILIVWGYEFMRPSESSKDGEICHVFSIKVNGLYPQVLTPHKSTFIQPQSVKNITLLKMYTFSKFFALNGIIEGSPCNGMSMHHEKRVACCLKGEFIGTLLKCQVL